MKKALPIFATVILGLVLLAGCGSQGASTNTDTNTNTTEGSKQQAGSSKQESTKEAFYKGKNVEVIVPFGAGGGTDAFGRFLATYLAQHTEGNPAVQVVNIPGGGSVNGANEFVLVRKPDGMTALLTSASTHTPYLLGESAVKYDLKKMRPVLGLPSGGVVYSSVKAGIQEPKDLLDPKEKLIYAGISATGLDLITLLSFEVLGADVQAILGYEGRGPSRVAFEQGESNIDYQTSTAYIKEVLPLIEEKKAQPLYSFGQLDENGSIVRDPAFPDIPSLKEYYESIYGKEPSGTAWDAYKAFLGASFTIQKVVWLHSDAPQEAYDALSKAAQAIAEDPDFNVKAEKALGGYKLVAGPTLEKTVNGMLEVKPETIQFVKDFLSTKYGVTFK